MPHFKDPIATCNQLLLYCTVRIQTSTVAESSVGQHCFKGYLFDVNLNTWQQKMLIIVVACHSQKPSFLEDEWHLFSPVTMWKHSLRLVIWCDY